jgi:dolichyl-phosphate-mannose-protein mannosyltransferase
MFKKFHNKGKFLLILIILIGALLRFYDVNWDQNQHLHPDERFLTMVGDAMKMPPSFSDYLDPHTSPMNPANIGYSFYVYGTFPVIFNKLLALATGNDNYNAFVLLGRIFSGFVDLLLVVIVFKTAEFFEKKYKLDSHVKYWSAFFYAIAVLPIQLSHFFATDTFLNSFTFISFYASLRFSRTKHFVWLLVGGLFFGLAIASKASAIFISPVLLYFFIIAYSDKKRIVHKDFLKIIRDLVIFGLVTYLVGRIADPYLFQNGNLLDPRPSQLFLANLKQLQALSNPQGWYPPGVQWIHKTPVLFGFKNLVLYGVGIGYTMCIALGIYYFFKKTRYTDLAVIFIWVILLFFYQSLQSVQTMRYFILIYPFLAFLAGIGFTYFSKQTRKIVQGVLLIIVIIWPLLFFSIYTKPITRVTASEWIYENIPAKSVILTEAWDDALPLSIDDLQAGSYNIQELPVFDPDTPQKWQKMDSMLSMGDYYVLSSNRGWGSIPTVPERYPKMTQFYKDLFAGKTDYKKVAEFTSFPSLSYLGIPLTINDEGAEEAFTVYDHPVVMIFKHER